MTDGKDMDPDAADVTALAMLRAENERLRQRVAELQILVDQDSLTGIANHRAFDRDLCRSIDSCQRYNHKMSLIYIDLDGFKDINDRFGHLFGDAILCAIAKQLLSNVRKSDIVARLGGDEFAVLLMKTSYDKAVRKACDLKAYIERMPITYGNSVLMVTISVGVMEWQKNMTTAEFLGGADAAMYDNKRKAHDLPNLPSSF